MIVVQVKPSWLDIVGTFAVVAVVVVALYPILKEWKGRRKRLLYLERKMMIISTSFTVRYAGIVKSKMKERSHTITYAETELYNELKTILPNLDLFNTDLLEKIHNFYTAFAMAMQTSNKIVDYTIVVSWNDKLKEIGKGIVLQQMRRHPIRWKKTLKKCESEKGIVLPKRWWKGRSEKKGD